MIIIRGSSTRPRASLCHRCRLHLQIGAVGGGRDRGCRLPHSLPHIVFLAATCRNIDLLPPASASNWSTRPPSRTAAGSCARHMRHAAPTSATATTTTMSSTNEGSSPPVIRLLPSASGGWRPRVTLIFLGQWSNLRFSRLCGAGAVTTETALTYDLLCTN